MKKIWDLIKALASALTQYHDYRAKSRSPYL